VTVAAFLSFAAAADIAVEDVNVQEPWVAGEWSLLDIYEAIYGVDTGYDTSDELYEAVGVDPDDYNGPDLSYFFGQQGIGLEARYASYTHKLGYYDPVLPDAIANQNLLFTVSGPYVDPGSSGGPSAVLDPAVEPYGFYLNVNRTTREWYSEYDRNSDAWVHMLLLAAPDEYVAENGISYLLAWEDLCADDPNDDWDYNDLVVLVGVVPEPSSIMLVGLGIASLAVGRLRKLLA